MPSGAATRRPPRQALLAADCTEALRFCLECDRGFHRARFALAAAAEAAGDAAGAAAELRMLFSSARRAFTIAMQPIAQSKAWRRLCWGARGQVCMVDAWGVGGGQMMCMNALRRSRQSLGYGPVGRTDAVPSLAESRQRASGYIYAPPIPPPKRSPTVHAPARLLQEPGPMSERWRPMRACRAGAARAAGGARAARRRERRGCERGRGRLGPPAGACGGRGPGGAAAQVPGLPAARPAGLPAPAGRAGRPGHAAGARCARHGAVRAEVAGGEARAERVPACQAAAASSAATSVHCEPARTGLHLLSSVTLCTRCKQALRSKRRAWHARVCPQILGRLG
jgi:hypothetical protein